MQHTIKQMSLTSTMLILIIYFYPPEFKSTEEKKTQIDLIQDIKKK